MTVLERLIQRHQEVWNELVAQAPARRGEDQGQARLERSRHPDDGVDRREGGGRPGGAAADRPGVHQPADLARASSRTSCRPIRPSATAAWCRCVKSAACQQWDKKDRLHRAQLDDKDNPYNTYQHDGLPPGPISNPGKGVDRSDAVSRRQRLLLLRGDREELAQPRVRADGRGAREERQEVRLRRRRQVS